MDPEQEGSSLFNQSLYFEAHEAWEQGWLKLSEPEKTQRKACIQVCGAIVLIQKGRQDAALRLVKKALVLLSEARAHSALLGRAVGLEIPGVEDFLVETGAKLSVGKLDHSGLKTEILDQARKLRAKGE